MFITLTWGNLRDQEFMAALGKLFTVEMHAKKTKPFKTLAKVIFAERKKSEAGHLELLRKYGVEEGKTGQYAFKDDNHAKFEEAMNEQNAIEFKTGVPKMLDSIIGENILFSPHEMLKLDPLFLDEESDEPALKLAPPDLTQDTVQ